MTRKATIQGKKFVGETAKLGSVRIDICWFLLGLFPGGTSRQLSAVLGSTEPVHRKGLGFLWIFGGAIRPTTKMEPSTWI